MKVNLDLIGRALIGKIGKLVFYKYKKSDVLLARAWVKPRRTINNDNLSSISTNLSSCYNTATVDYRNDLINYATQLNLATVGENCIYNAYNCFVKMMYAMNRLYPAIDLKTITADDIVFYELPAISVRMAVENDLLPRVRYIDGLGHEIV
ncbi:MAG: hypothetical protein P9L91_04425 [Candidatus Zophobacter franzmannii]|nr:hypothetical protein [Candidatus Zophobacter franzmannii]